MSTSSDSYDPTSWHFKKFVQPLCISLRCYHPNKNAKSISFLPFAGSDQIVWLLFLTKRCLFGGHVEILFCPLGASSDRVAYCFNQRLFCVLRPECLWLQINCFSHCFEPPRHTLNRRPWWTLPFAPCRLLLQLKFVYGGAVLINTSILLCVVISFI